MFELTIYITLILFCIWAQLILIKSMFEIENINMTIRDNISWIFKRTLYGLGFPNPSGYKKIKKLFTLANVTTLVGFIAITAYLTALVLSYFFHIQIDNSFYLEMITLVILSDVEDGACARSLNECTKFGEIFDPVRDRYYVLVILLHITLFSPVLIFFSTLIVAIEYYILKMNLKYNISVHFFGKLRMAIHMICGIIFVTQNAGHELTVHMSNLSLVSLMLFGTMLAFVKYYAQSKGYTLRDIYSILLLFLCCILSHIKYRKYRTLN